MLENNHNLHHLPHYVGCQQSILIYSSQASWAAMAAPTVQNIADGVWNIRLYGCSEQQEGDDENDQSLSVRVCVNDKMKTLRLPQRLENICKIPKLLEMSAKTVYNFLTPRLRLRVKCVEDIKLPIPTLQSFNSSDHHHEDHQIPLHHLHQLLPANLVQLLSAPPVTFCSNPRCCQPIFRECFLRIVEVKVQRSWIGGGNIEMKSFLASQYYCGEHCFRSYRDHPDVTRWEMEDLVTKNVTILE